MGVQGNDNVAVKLHVLIVNSRLYFKSVKIVFTIKIIL
jgi:hypothetical protein